MGSDKDKAALPPPIIITEPYQRRDVFAALFVHANLSRPVPPEMSAQFTPAQRQALAIESAVSHADALMKKLDAGV